MNTKKHQNPDNWVTFYRTKCKKTKVNKNKIINELSICGQYQKNVFYKIQSMSKKDEVFDYYRILKEDINDYVITETSDEDIEETEKIINDKKNEELKKNKEMLIVNFNKI